MRILAAMVTVVLAATACTSSAPPQPATATPVAVVTATVTVAVDPTPDQAATQPGPGGYGFDRSDPEAGVANIMDAFATDEATATCIFEAWGDLANVPPEELTPKLMVYEVCGTSIFQMISGDGRFTSSE